MREARRIDDQLYRGFEGDAWHGPSLMAALDGVDAKTAAARPIPGAHSIWELVLHLAVWLDIPKRRLEQWKAIEATPEQDWQTVEDTSEEAWRLALERLRQSYQGFRDLLATVDEDRIGETSPGRDYPVYVMIHGVVQHLAYHSGQIALLKKAQSR